jgi:membrane protein implicated in regulation of membrane protease activity
VRFEPLRPASRRAVTAAFVFGPLAWLAALIIAAIVLDYTGALLFGLTIAGTSFVLSIVVLSLIHAARRRQEKRYAERR